jgi:hypothetical protein
MWHCRCFVLLFAGFIETSVGQSIPSVRPFDVSKIPVDRLTPDLLNLTVIIVFVILFLRTAAPSVNSRYLKHLAGAYALIGLFYLSSILLVQYKLILFFSAQGQEYQVDALFKELDKVGELIKLIFSSLSSCFLLLTWYLLRHYPKQGISRTFYGSVFTAYCIAIPAIIGVAQVFEWQSVVVLNVTDSVFAFIGVLMVGFGLCQLIWHQKELSGPVRDIATLLVAIAFLCWALPQPLYESHQGYVWFWVLLAIGKVIAGLAAILVSVAVLKAKPGFQGSE